MPPTDGGFGRTRENQFQGISPPGCVLPLARERQTETETDRERERETEGAAEIPRNAEKQ